MDSEHPYLTDGEGRGGGARRTEALGRWMGMHVWSGDGATGGWLSMAAMDRSPSM